MLAHKFGLKSNKYYKSKQMELQKHKNIEYKKKKTNPTRCETRRQSTCLSVTTFDAALRRHILVNTTLVRSKTLTSISSSNQFQSQFSSKTEVNF